MYRTNSCVNGSDVMVHPVGHLEIRSGMNSAPDHLMPFLLESVARKNFIDNAKAFLLDLVRLRDRRFLRWLFRVKLLTDRRRKGPDKRRCLQKTKNWTNVGFRQHGIPVPLVKLLQNRRRIFLKRHDGQTTGVGKKISELAPKGFPTFQKSKDRDIFESSPLFELYLHSFKVQVMFFRDDQNTGCHGISLRESSCLSQG